MRNIESIQKGAKKILGVVAVFGALMSAAPAFATVSNPISATELLPTNIQGEIGLSGGDVRITIARIIREAMAFIGIVMVVLMLYAGFLWMTAAGSDEQIGKAKKIIVAAIIGLAVVLSSYALTGFVINQLVIATAG